MGDPRSSDEARSSKNSERNGKDSHSRSSEKKKASSDKIRNKSPTAVARNQSALEYVINGSPAQQPGQDPQALRLDAPSTSRRSVDRTDAENPAGKVEKHRRRASKRSRSKSRRRSKDRHGKKSRRSSSSSSWSASSGVDSSSPRRGVTSTDFREFTAMIGNVLQQTAKGSNPEVKAHTPGAKSVQSIYTKVTTARASGPSPVADQGNPGTGQYTITELETVAFNSNGFEGGLSEAILPDSIENLIENDEYVDLHDLLYPNVKSFNMTVGGDNETPNLALKSSKRRKLTELEWCNAFDTFAIAYHKYYPSAFPGVLLYGKFIKRMMLKNRINWHYYDEVFRKERKARRMPWTVSRQDLFNNLLLEQPEAGPSGNGSFQKNRSFRDGKSQFNGRDSVQPGYCFAYNQTDGRCTKRDCTYKHRCEKCNERHPTYNHDRTTRRRSEDRRSDARRPNDRRRKRRSPPHPRQGGQVKAITN